MLTSLADKNFIAKAALFLALLVPALLPIHRYPQTVFFNEWAAGLALLGLLVAMVNEYKVLQFRLSVVPIALLVLAIWATSQWAGGLGVSVPVLTGLWCYLLLTLLAYLLGSVLASNSRTEHVNVMAVSLMLAALLQCAVSVAQLAGWNAGGMVMPKILNSAYGNIAQPNHFGNLIWLGLVSGLYLYLRGRLLAHPALIGAVVLCAFSALSASRAVLLYTVAIPVLAIVYCYKNEGLERLRIWRAVAVLAIVSVATQLWVGLGGAGKFFGVASSLGRLNDAGSNTQRLFDWSVALHTSLEHPLAGSGVGTFAWQTGLHSIGLPPATVIRIGENAHNTILNLAAEDGLLVTGVVTVLAALWLWRRLREKPSLENFWALGILTVIGAHSMVEYPLWYTYFLLPVGLVIGMIDAEDRKLPVINISHNWLFLPLIVGVFILGWTYNDYMRLEEGYRIANTSDELTTQELSRAEQLAKSVNPYSMFATHAGILRLLIWRTSAVDKSKDMAILCDSAARVKLSRTVLTQCVSAYAMQGRQADTELMVDVVCGAFPPAVRQEFPQLVHSIYEKQGWMVPVKAGCL